MNQLLYRISRYDELYHHGILGMHWGVRRYQNEDGSLTELGKKRRGQAQELTKHSKQVKSAFNDTLSGVRKITSANKPTGQANPNRYNKRKTLTQDEMDKMSDKELQQLVNRLNLETQYSNLTREPAKKSSVQIGLEYAEGVVSIVGAAMSIYAIVNKN